MKTAAEKSAVRWSCAFLAVLFFFCAVSCLTMRRMQMAYGCAAGDTAGQNRIISDLIDENVEELTQSLFPLYYQAKSSVQIYCPPQFRSENTNFRFRAYDDENRVISETDDGDLKTDDGKKVRFSKTIIVEVEVPARDDGILLEPELVNVYCALDEDLKVNDVFRRTLSLMQIGASLEDVFWALGVIFSAAALFFCVLAVRSVLREAKRPKGADRLFNALPPDWYVCCVLPAFVLFGKLLSGGIRDKDLLKSYMVTGTGEYRLLLRPACMTGMFALLLVLLLLLVFSLRRGGIQYVFSFRRFVQAPFPRRMVLYLVVMQFVKGAAIALYLTAYTRWVILFLLLEKLITLPVVFRSLRQLRALMDNTAQFVQGDLSGRASREGDYATLRAHGADVDAIVRRISDSAEEYVRSSRFKAELITNLSHDIKTPLTSIISYAQLLERDDLTQEERAKYIEVLQRHSDRLQKLVEDLTEVSDAVSGNVSVQMTMLDLCSLVHTSALNFEERLQKQDISLRFCLPAEPVFVMGDPRLLQRVTDNLMNNICKYTRTGTEVQIAVVDGASSVAAVFRNRSLKPLTLSGDALMERFVREDGARHTDGSGLGLSIAQSLMHLQGGKLWLHTQGDVFTAQILFRKS